MTHQDTETRITVSFSCDLDTAVYLSLLYQIYMDPNNCDSVAFRQLPEALGYLSNLLRDYILNDDGDWEIGDAILFRFEGYYKKLMQDFLEIGQ